MKRALLCLLLAACRPDFGLPVSVVTAPRLLAVDLQPPEARPGDTVHVTAHAASPDGVMPATVDYAFCTSPRPLVEDNVVSSDCLGSDDHVSKVASAAVSVDATLPLDGCLEFGPETPPQKPGAPPLRPRDPDATGGYYQPLRVVLPGLDQAIALVRIRCNLPGASAQAAVAFAAKYTNNTNPLMGPLTLTANGATLDPAQVPASATVTLHVDWSPGTSEHYVVHDRASDALVEHSEALRVSWFTTSGTIPVVTTGRAGGDDGLDARTEWKTGAAGPATLWAVIRDDRGGSSVQSLTVTVR